jgi:hypothetical protein
MMQDRKSTVFLDVTLRTLAARDPEDGVITLLRNVSKILPDYVAETSLKIVLFIVTAYVMICFHFDINVYLYI